MKLDEINRLDRDAFVEKIGWVCEHSPWVSERAWESIPFTGIEDLHAAMVREITRAAETEQLSLLNAHPDLGTRVRVSPASASEQNGAGLDQLTPEEFTLFASLNEEYRRKFAFPFLFAVKGSDKHQILASMRERIRHTREEEFEEALRQTTRIIRFRLETIVDTQST